MAPKKKTGSKASEKDREQFLAQAIEEIKSKKLTFRKASLKYGIPKSTLRDHVAGITKGKRRGPSLLLTAEEEKILVNFIHITERRAMPVTKEKVLDTVAAILAEEKEQGIQRFMPLGCDKPSYRPSKKWWYAFLKRNPQISIRTPENLSRARKSVTKQSILQWFASVREYFAEEGCESVLLDPSRNFNLDETGFSLSPKTEKVLAIKGQKDVYFETSGKEKTNITILACISGDGSIPPPMVIFPRKCLSREILEDAKGHDCALGQSNSGYIIREVFFEYMCNHFHNWLNKNNIQRPVVVWTDWHESRIWYHLSKQLKKQDIILYGIPPNTTHFLQPLDVSVFGPLKKVWKQHVKEWQEANDTVLGINNFVSCVMPMFFKNISPQNVVNGFRGTGLHPFDSSAPDYTKIRTAETYIPNIAIFEEVDQDGKVERGTQTTCHMSVSVGMNVRTATPSYQSLLESKKYNKDNKFFSDDMALTNGFQILDLMSRKQTLKTGYPSQPVNKTSGDDILSYPSLPHVGDLSPLPLSPHVDDLSPSKGLADETFSLVPSTLDNPEPSTDLFEGAHIDEDTPMHNDLENPRRQPSTSQHQETTIVPAKAPAPMMEEMMKMMMEMKSQIKALQERQSADLFLATPQPCTSKGFQSSTTKRTPQSTLVSTMSESLDKSPLFTSSMSAQKKVSEVSKNFKFCPSPRKEQGPKRKMVSLRDHTFAISEQGIALLEAEREEQLQQEEEKKKKQETRQKKKVPQSQAKTKKKRQKIS